VRHEDLGRAPEATLRRLAQHCALQPADEADLVSRWSPRLASHTPTSDGLDAAARARVTALTAATAARFDYA
jgi:hypothetical protein